MSLFWAAPPAKERKRMTRTALDVYKDRIAELEAEVERLRARETQPSVKALKELNGKVVRLNGLLDEVDAAVDHRSGCSCEGLEYEDTCSWCYEMEARVSGILDKRKGEK